jgi:outer membrane protein assembly factor BamB
MSAVGTVILACSARHTVNLDNRNYDCTWNQAGGGPGHTAFISALIGGAPELLWKRDLKTPILNEPTIWNGYIFLPTPNKNILVLDQESGENVAQFEASGPVTSPIAVFDSIMVYNEYGQRLVASNWILNQRVWVVDLYGSEFAPLILSGRVYWHDGRRSITCFDLHAGKRIWSIVVDYDITAPLSACTLGVVVVSNRGMIECLSPEDGRVIWTQQITARVKNAPVIDYDHLVYCTVDGMVTLADMRTGTSLWNYDLAMPVVAPLAIDSGSVYIAAHHGRFIKLDLAEGHIDWTVDLDGPIKGGPSILGNIIIIATLNHRVFFVDKNEGKIISEYPTFGMISSRPVACSDRIYVAGEDEKLYCFQLLRKNE